MTCPQQPLLRITPGEGKNVVLWGCGQLTLGMGQGCSSLLCSS